MNLTGIAVRLLTIFLLFTGFVLPLHAAISVDLQSATPSPSTVGTTIQWVAQATDTNDGQLWYRFRVMPPNGDFRTIRDFGPSSELDWTSLEPEGTYTVEVSVQNQATGEVVVTSAPFELDSRVTLGYSLIGATENPLVFIYSSPSCRSGSTMLVYFWRADGTGQTQQTYSRGCGASSMNFYLAGMEANTTYFVQHLIDMNGPPSVGPLLQVTTGSVPATVGGFAFATETVLQDSASPTADWILLQGPLGRPPFATDLSGNIVWYYPQPLTMFTRVSNRGMFLGINNTGNDSSTSLVRLFNLAGTTIQETNAAQINTQLDKLGKRHIGVFHHEARMLANGNILLLGTVEQILTDVQGSGPVDVIGDMVIILDSNLQVTWTWDAFDHLDVTRAAVLGETCIKNGSCMSHFLAPDGNDWTHANSVQETPDGDLLLSLRHQDWVLKLNYGSGSGDGSVIWRLGKDGDFVFESNDNYPWFSHQHDVGFLSDSTTMTLFDNGNTRKTLVDPSANSRGQVLMVDQDNRTVRSLLSQDLGVFSSALGSAQKLPNGDYHFDAGTVNFSEAISFELNQDGNPVRAVQAGNVMEYRTFRLKDLYTVP
jgi:arylsulfate sulfotransferase